MGVFLFKRLFHKLFSGGLIFEGAYYGRKEWLDLFCKGFCF